MDIGKIEKIGDREMPGYTPPAKDAPIPERKETPAPEKAPATAPEREKVPA